MRPAVRATLAILILAGVSTLAWGDSEPEPIPLIGGVFTPRKGTLDLDDSLADTDPLYKGHAYIQLDSKLTKTVEDDLKDEGVELLDHVHGRTFLARVNARRSVLNRIIPPVGAAIARIPPSTKKDPGIARWAAAKTTNSYLIRFHRDVRADDVSPTFRRLGLSVSPSRRCDCWEANLSLADVSRVAELDIVRRIEPNDFHMTPFTHEIRNATQVDAIQGFSGTASSYGFSRASGAGVTIGILDLGVASADHHAYQGVDASGVLDSNSRYTAYGSPASLHAAWMAGIIGANGVDTPASYGTLWDLRGLAPQSTLFGMSVVGSEYAIFKEALVDHAADLTNNSYGDDSPTNGVSLALDDDAIIWGSAIYGGVTIPARPAVWAIGNSGTDTTTLNSADNGYFSVHNPQKNGIIVGGSVIDRSTSPMSSLTRWDGSSIGPTFDGRVKPDLMAPACKEEDDTGDELVRSTNLVDGTYSAAKAYGQVGECGTSFSAAAVTGIASLMLEEWRAVRGSTSRPRPSTLKAALIQGALDMTTSSLGPVYRDGTSGRVAIDAFDGPDYATGYGEVDAAASFAVISEQRVIEDQVLLTDEIRSYRVVVPEGAARLRITLVWDDPPESGATTVSAQKLVNDLDLTVSGPLETTATTYLPWSLPVLSPPPSYDPTWVPTELRAATPGADRRNNVEQVEVSSPAAGTYEISVKAYALSFAFAQPYALASDLPLGVAVGVDVFRSYRGEPASLENSLSPQQLSRLDQDPNANRWIIVPTSVSCLVKGTCLTCGRWGQCEPVRMQLAGVPRDWRVELVDQRGVRIDPKLKRRRDRLELELTPRPGLTTFLALKPPAKRKRPLPAGERVHLIPVR